MVTVVVERNLAEPVTRAQIERGWAAASGCLTLHQVRHVQTYLAHDGLRMVCIYEAPDAESVRVALRQAQTRPWERLYAVTTFESVPKV